MEKLDIKKIRQKLKMTQDVFAGKLGVKRLTVSNWENEFARPSMLAYRQIERLARKHKLNLEDYKGEKNGNRKSGHGKINTSGTISSGGLLPSSPRGEKAD